MKIRRAIAVLLACACAATLVACNGDGETGAIPGAAVAVEDPFSGGYPTYDHEETGLRIVFGTPDLGVGASRVSFALFTADGLVSVPTLEVVTRFYPDGPDEPYQEAEHATLRFRPFPDGGRGIYTGALTFNAAGLWALDVAVPMPEGVEEVVFPVEVAPEFVAPKVGAPAPASDNRTAGDVASLEELTTATSPDPSLYDLTIADALARGTPFVVTFASPAFCTNALCGPQVEVLSELEATYSDEAEFIHVELYENPIEIRGDFSVARRTPVLDEWGLHTDEWTFVVGRNGTVTARFEGFAPIEEVEAALLAALASTN